jgi:hypothetical protein
VDLPEVPSNPLAQNGMNCSGFFYYWLIIPCWQGKLGRQRAKGKELFFRFVPCGKSNKTVLNNG